MTVDHIFPQDLSYDPIRKKKVFLEYGLPATFDIESYDNWLPCHQWENREKSNIVFDASTTRFFLGIAKGKSETAANIEKKWRKKKRNDKILYILEVALVKGEITKDQVYHVIAAGGSGSEKQLRRENEPIVIAFGLTIEMVQQQEMYSEEILSDLPSLYNQLEADLKDQLSSIVSCKFFICEELRDGESFTIRIAFEDPDPEEIKKFETGPWEVLEIRWFSEIYDN
jgi:hypothetical protein